MHSRACIFAPAFLVLAASLFAACSDNDFATANSATVAGPRSVRAALVTVEPAAIVPEFLSSTLCGGLRPFGARVGVRIRPGHDVFLQAMGFEFIDRFGRRATPFALAAPNTGTSLSILPPVPLPSSLPIPIPTHLPFHGVQLSPGNARIFPFLLRFDCGVGAEGTLFVVVETTDSRGAVDVVRASAVFGSPN
jgi:hypothetical protein